MENLREMKVYASNKEAYEALFDNVTAMLLVQGLNPNTNREELYITFDNDKKKDAEIESYIMLEVKEVFGVSDKSKRFSIKKGKKKNTLTFIASGRWE